MVICFKNKSFIVCFIACIIPTQPLLKFLIYSLELKDRSFKTLEFYRERQDKLTPAGLSFFQCNWDPTARKIFHEILNMEEPIFEYDFDPQPLRKQTAFPSKESFNM